MTVVSCGGCRRSQPERSPLEFKGGARGAARLRAEALGAGSAAQGSTERPKPNWFSRCVNMHTRTALIQLYIRRFPFSLRYATRGAAMRQPEAVPLKPRR